jgi:hypothetical protein
MGSYPSNLKPYKYLFLANEKGQYGYPQDISTATLGAYVQGKDIIKVDVSEGNLSSPSADSLYEDGETSWLAGTAQKKLAHYNMENELNLLAGLRELRFLMRTLFSAEDVITPGPHDAIESVLSGDLKSPKSLLIGAGYYQGTPTTDGVTADAREVDVYGAQINTLELDGSAEDGTLSVNLASIYAQFDQHNPIRDSTSPNPMFSPDSNASSLEWADILSMTVKQTNSCVLASGSLDELTGSAGEIKVSFERNLDQDKSLSVGTGIFSGKKTTGSDGFSATVELTLKASSNQSPKLQEVFFGQDGSTDFKKELQSGVYFELKLKDRNDNLATITLPYCTVGMDGSRSFASDDTPTINLTATQAGDVTVKDASGTDHGPYHGTQVAYFDINEASTVTDKLTCFSLVNNTAATIEIDLKRINDTPFWNRRWILKDVLPGDTFKFRLPKGTYQYSLIKAGAAADVGPCTITLTSASPATYTIPINACLVQLAETEVNKETKKESKKTKKS